MYMYSNIVSQSESKSEDIFIKLCTSLGYSCNYYSNSSRTILTYIPQIWGRHNSTSITFSLVLSNWKIRLVHFRVVETIRSIFVFHVRIEYRIDG